MSTSKAMNSKHITSCAGPNNCITVAIEYGGYIECMKSIPKVIQRSCTKDGVFHVYRFWFGFWFATGAIEEKRKEEEVTNTHRYTSSTNDFGTRTLRHHHDHHLCQLNNEKWFQFLLFGIHIQYLSTIETTKLYLSVHHTIIQQR